MAADSLEAWTRATRSSWGPLSSSLIEECHRYFERLARTPPTEEWLAALLREKPATQLLQQDAAHGFMLLAHTEEEGLYRPPHDHGRSWVMYAVHHGEVDMGTYATIQTGNGLPDRLVRRDVTRVKPGQVQVYLPGDIHDTLCVSGPALLFRFTERDLQLEKEQRLMRRYGSEHRLPVNAAA